MISTFGQLLGWGLAVIAIFVVLYLFDRLIKLQKRVNFLEREIFNPNFPEFGIRERLKVLEQDLAKRNAINDN